MTMHWRLRTVAPVSILAVGSAVMIVVSVLAHLVDRRGRRLSPSERGRLFGAELIGAMRSGIATGPQPDTLDRIGRRIERGDIRPSPFWTNLDD